MPETVLTQLPADVSDAKPAVGTMPLERLGPIGSGLPPSDREDMRKLFSGARPDKPAIQPAVPTQAPPVEPAKSADAPPAPPAPSAPAEPPKPAEPLVLDAEKLLQDSTIVPSKAAEWTKFKATLKGELDRVIAERDALKQKISELGEPEVLKSLGAERDELQQMLRRVAIERDPGFKKQFDNQRSALIEDVKTVLGPKGVEAIDILSKHGGNAHPLLEEWAGKNELSHYQTMSLLGAVRGLRDLEISRERMIADTTANWEKHQTEQALAASRAADQNKRELLTALQERLEVARKDNGLFRTREGDEKWNEAVASTPQLAQSYVLGEGLDSDGRAQMAMRAASYPLLAREYERLAAAYGELKKQAASLTAAQPGNRSSTLTPPTSTVSDPSKMTVGERAVAELRAAGISVMPR